MLPAPARLLLFALAGATAATNATNSSVVALTSPPAPPSSPPANMEGAATALIVAAGMFTLCCLTAALVTARWAAAEARSDSDDGDASDMFCMMACVVPAGLCALGLAIALFVIGGGELPAAPEPATAMLHAGAVVASVLVLGCVIVVVVKAKDDPDEGCCEGCVFCQC